MSKRVDSKNNNEKKVTLEYCFGSNSGKALYLCFDNAGLRIAGCKCWGFVKKIETWELNEEDLESLIDRAKKAKKFLQKQIKKGSNEQAR